MSERKIRKSYVYTGLGFPVILKNVPMIKVWGVWTPDINYNHLRKAVLLTLAYLKSPLTGAQVRFIRKYFTLTLVDFAKMFDVTHSAVIKWEKQEAESAKISSTTEKAIRFFVLDSLLDNPLAFQTAYRKLFEHRFKSKKAEVIHINMQNDLSIAM
jgi:DNA-binding transcriptional regulator YiaG